MKHRNLLLASLMLLNLPILGMDGSDGQDKRDNLGFLAGEYILIGKKIDSSDTYTGGVRFIYDEEAGILNMTREIGGRKVAGTAVLEPVLAGEALVLRLRFVDEGTEYEGTFLWQSDLDNYGRLSGYIYVRGTTPEDPGLEAYFIQREPS